MRHVDSHEINQCSQHEAIKDMRAIIDEFQMLEVDQQPLCLDRVTTLDK